MEKHLLLEEVPYLFDGRLLTGDSVVSPGISCDQSGHLLL